MQTNFIIIFFLKLSYQDCNAQGLIWKVFVYMYEYSHLSFFGWMWKPFEVGIPIRFKCITSTMKSQSNVSVNCNGFNNFNYPPTTIDFLMFGLSMFWHRPYWVCAFGCACKLAEWHLFFRLRMHNAQCTLICRSSCHSMLLIYWNHSTDGSLNRYIFYLPFISKLNN